MRIAVAGKGGAGKTTVCATAARLLARSGVRVVAIDGDTNPNLHSAIGVDPAAALPTLPVSLVSRRFDGPRLAAPVDDVLEQHAAAAPDGVRLVRMGMPQHADEGCMCSAHATVSALLADLGEAAGTVTLLDLEASPEHLSRGTARHADVLVLVVEPYYRSLEAARLQSSLAAETSIGRVAVLANKCRHPSDTDAIEEYCSRHGLELIGVLPWSEAVLDADALSEPLLDHNPSDPVVDALAALVGSLVHGAPPRPESVSGPQVEAGV
ncbi:MAG: AAA family ATPase [Acidimicrobiaceae bacterium]|nr:AAA family ATPase [Acidimicrobiaceae bacterium]MXZ97698.1 AAA family ATPase [Acidimicrobiaceae bacterium]MYE76511.1 AAA family ATPase [Acidimicrobiaceae bacterium]MYE95808.1 AAA family ATPase [Acidimicrobiaceae bacterium]MYH42992.1 AAA family ATPase [Acidimicrobiaceae bacterium]